MKGNKTIIKHLNQVLKNELTAINQYFLHSKMFKDWGYIKLADYEYKESIDEMKHADQIIARLAPGEWMWFCSGDNTKLQAKTASGLCKVEYMCFHMA